MILVRVLNILEWAFLSLEVTLSVAGTSCTQRILEEDNGLTLKYEERWGVDDRIPRVDHAHRCSSSVKHGRCHHDTGMDKPQPIQHSGRNSRGVNNRFLRDTVARLVGGETSEEENQLA